ncbi:ketopantoate reductase family protein [Phreatobacter oligotrophus]|uniref:2-dehydropantoate 2-reductase n=1 Tax=Phreatobacter oligotrophus TaxID=1122261 RepID=A0A2T4YXX5_9HYPH|nr:2-dehydropantoate 2-reductase [Phreatobacter oligotrophus]PTM51397.1 ketopantoate reductase [Phreatobacter oligotrophus]
MKVCIFGAGAVGGNAAARLIAARDAEVSVVARGAHLAAIREKGLTLHTGGETLGGMPHAATDDPSTLPPQDLVVVTLKAHSLPAIAGQIRALLAPGAAAVFFTNGVPWWWNHGIDEEAGSLPLLDPDGLLWRDLGPDSVLGGVVYSANAVTEPGVITHTAGNRWIIGEPTGYASPRADAAAEVFQRAGLGGEVTTDIRKAMWEKLALNIAANPLCALSRLPLGRWHEVPGIGALGIGMIKEMLAVAKALGWDLTSEVDPAAALPARPGRPGGKPSMLQDAEAGRPMEVEAIVGQLQAFGRDHGVPTPAIDVVLPLLRALDAAVSKPPVKV